MGAGSVTVDLTGRSFAPDSLELVPGASLSFIGGETPAIDYPLELSISAAELMAGERFSFPGAALSFAEGSTVTISDFHDLDLSTAVTYVIAEAGSIAGFDNIEFSPSAPPKWSYRLLGDKLALVPVRGFAFIVK